MVVSQLLSQFAGSVTVPNESVGIPQVAADDAAFANIIGAVFVVLGGVAVLFLLIGAIRYMISAGDQSSVQKAKNTILYAIVGLVISLLAFAIVQFVLGRIG